MDEQDDIIECLTTAAQNVKFFYPEANVSVSGLDFVCVNGLEVRLSDDLKGWTIVGSNGNKLYSDSAVGLLQHYDELLYKEY